MKFDELDTRMRVFETAHDYSVLPGLYMVARIEGRNFTRLTKEVHKFEAPYDGRFRDMMIETTAHLMNCGFRSLYLETYGKSAKNPLTGEEVTATRRRLTTDMELPMKDEYGSFIVKLIEDALAAEITAK